MTNCTPNTFTFSPLARKKIAGNFAGRCITSDVDDLLFREMDKKFVAHSETRFNRRDGSRVPGRYSQVWHVR